VEQSRIVERAKRAYMNLLRRHSRPRELVASGAPEIEARLCVARKPRLRIRVCQKLIRQLGSHFVVAWADARTDCGDDVIRLRTVCRHQGTYGDHSSACGRALPAGVHCGYSAGSAIGQQQWDTVCHSYAEGKRRIVADGNIRLRPVRKRGRDPFFGDKHICAVNLTHTREGIELHSERSRQRVPAIGFGITDAFEGEFTRAEAVAGDLSEGPAS
jgi:hypothetical protein